MTILQSLRFIDRKYWVRLPVLSQFQKWIRSESGSIETREDNSVAT